jgi:hypothetical protein
MPSCIARASRAHTDMMNRSSTHASGTDRLAGAAPRATLEPLENRMLMSLSPAGEPFRVNTPGTFDWMADVAMDADGDSVAAWFHLNEDFSDGWPVARLFDAQGQAKGPEIRLDTGTKGVQNNPWIAMDDDGNFVAGFVANDSNLYVRLFDAAGAPRGPEIQVDGDVLGDPGQSGWPYIDLAMNDDGGFAVVWKHNDNVNGGLLYARRYDAAGAPVSAAFRVDESPAANASAMDPQVAVNDKGEMFVAWRRRNPSEFTGAGELYGRVFSDTNIPEGGQFVIDGFGDHSAPSVAAARTNFVVSWRDSAGVAGGPQSVRAQRFNRHGQAQAAPVLVESDLPGNEGVFYGGPWVDAANDGRFAVAWSRPKADNSGPGTAYLRQYDTEGNPSSAAVQLGTGPDSFDGLNGFAADDNLQHGMLVWFNNSDWSVAGQFVTDPGASAGAALPELAAQGRATDLLSA